jgi:hypothetical protein
MVRVVGAECAGEGLSGVKWVVTWTTKRKEFATNLTTHIDCHPDGMVEVKYDYPFSKPHTVRDPGANTAACPRRLTTFEINTPRSATDQANPSSS